MTLPRIRKIFNIRDFIAQNFSLVVEEGKADIVVFCIQCINFKYICRDIVDIDALVMYLNARGCAKTGNSILFQREFVKWWK